jgi:hypothetical protein
MIVTILSHSRERRTLAASVIMIIELLTNDTTREAAVIAGMIFRR